MLYPIIIAVVAILVGGFVGYLVRKKVAQSEANSVEAKMQIMIEEAKTKEREILLQAKDKALSVIDQAKKEEESRRQELKEQQKRLEKRENLFDQKLLDLESKQTKILEKAKQLETVKQEINDIKTQQLEKLEKIAQMNKQDAQEVLLKNVQSEMQDALMSRIRKIEEENSTLIDEKARVKLVQAIQRCAVSHAVEATTTIVDLPSDEMKGRIIGREGRNIKTLEQRIGVEIVVDDTPNVITISGFSPIRRHVCKRALEKLILDGRIHPAKIEDAIEEAKKEIAVEIKKAGEDACYELGIAGLDPKLVQIIGRLKYRTSYGQNALRHSVEVAHLSGLLAAELGADVTLAKKGGLLHDIGKAVDHEVKGTHPEIGGNIARKFNLPQDIIDPIETHHDDHPRGLISVIVKVADAISSSRPGARNDSLDQYIQRLEELEKIANNFEGVDKTYAIQAGREIRVFVKPDEINDLSAHEMAVNIAKQIEQDLKYPGEIKVNIIRELRVIEYAR